MPWAPLALALLLAGVHYLTHADFTMDDAGISYAYARTLADGHGLGELYPNAPRVEGYSNLLWVVLLTAGAQARIDIDVWAKILGFAFALASVAVVHQIARSLLHHDRVLWGVGLYSLTFSSFFWFGSGLENALYVFLVLLSARLLLDEAEVANGPEWRSAVALLLVALTRPEGILFGLAAAVYKLAAAVQRRSGGRTIGRLFAGSALWAGILAGGYGTYLWWHWSFYASPLPNTATAKVGTPRPSTALVAFTDLSSLGWRYVGAFVRDHGLIFLLPPLTVGAVVALGRRAGLLVVFCAASLALPLYAPDWMVHFRFMYALPALAVLLTLLGVDWLLRATRRSGHQSASVRSVAAGLLAVSLLGALCFGVDNASTTANIQRRGYAGYVTLQEISSGYGRLERVAGVLGLDDPLYLLPDVGGTAYVNNIRVLDSGGLSDYHVAHSGWDRSVLEQYFFAEKRPEIVSTHGLWSTRTGLPTMDALRRGYVRVVHEGTIEQFVRRDLFVDKRSVGRSMGASATGLSLESWVSPEAAPPGRTLTLELGWRALSPQATQAVQRVSVVGSDGEPASSVVTPMGYGWYPATAWRADEVVRHRATLQLPKAVDRYTIEVSVGQAGGAEVVYRKDIVVHDGAARIERESRRRRAAHLARQGDHQEALAELSLAAQVGPRDAPLVEQLRRTRGGAMEAAMADAEARFGAGDDDGALGAVRRAVELRGREAPLASWRRFARILRTTAAAASKNGSRGKAYKLYQAATELNPSDPWAQRELERTRRAYLDSTGGTADGGGLRA